MALVAVKFCRVVELKWRKPPELSIRALSRVLVLKVMTPPVPLLLNWTLLLLSMKMVSLVFPWASLIW